MSRARQRISAALIQMDMDRGRWMAEGVNDVQIRSDV